MPRLVRLLPALFIALIAPSGGGVAAADDVPPFSGILAQFVAERDAILCDPAASVEDYRALVEQAGERVEYAGLSLNDLARGTFEGVFDGPASREQAELQLLSFPGVPPEVGARVSVIHLRLAGTRTVFGTPPDAQRVGLVSAVLDSEGLLVLWQSPMAAEALEALCTSGCSTLLKERRDRIRELLTALDPRGDGNLATRLDGLVLLSLLSATYRQEFTDDVQVILAFGRASLEAAEDASDRAEIETQCRWVEAIAQGAYPVGRAGLDRVDLSLAALEEVVAEDRAAYSRFARYLGNILDVGMLAGGELQTSFLIQRPPEETVFRVSPSAYEIPAQTSFRAFDLVRSADGRVFRAFGGFELKDPVVRFSCSDLAVDENRGVGFARELSLRGQLISLRVNRVDVAGGEWAAADTEVEARLGPLPLVGLSARSLEQVEPGRARLTDGKLRLFGISLVGIPDRKFSSEMAEGDEEQEEKPAARGQSPALLWYKIPSIGIQEGGISLSYANSLKFAQRWTGSLGLRTAPGHPLAYNLGANYNLLDITNERDLFLAASDLQQDSFSSYLYQVENREPLQENSDLFDRTLFVGAYTEANRLYIDPDGNSQTVSIPVSVGVEGGGGIGDGLGVRVQASYEKVRDREIGEESRLVLTGVAGPRPLRLARGVDLLLRAEGITRAGDDRYTWYRGIAGATALLSPSARLSAGYVQSWEDGTPTFPYDQVKADRGYLARLDLRRDPYGFTYMNHYSQDQQAWFRSQWLVSRAMNLADVYLAYDELYHRYSFGFVVRLDNLYDKVARRRVTSIDSGECLP